MEKPEARHLDRVRHIWRCRRRPVSKARRMSMETAARLFRWRRVFRRLHGAARMQRLHEFVKVERIDVIVVYKGMTRPQA